MNINENDYCYCYFSQAAQFSWAPQYWSSGSTTMKVAGDTDVFGGYDPGVTM
jgi:hypothetical protein